MQTAPMGSFVYFEQFPAQHTFGKFGKRLSIYSLVVAIIILDTIAFIVTAVLSQLLSDGFIHSSSSLQDWQIDAVIFAIFSHFIGAGLFKPYTISRILHGHHGVVRLVLCLAGSFGLMMFIAIATKTTEHYSRLWFCLWALLTLLLIVTMRLAFLVHITDALKEGACIERALSVGVFCDPLSSSEVARHTHNRTRVLEGLRFSDIDDLAYLSDRVTHDDIDQIFITVPWNDIPKVLNSLRKLQHLATQVFVLPSVHSLGQPLEKVSNFGGHLSLCMIEEPIHGWDLWMKRMEDVVLATMGLAAVSPLLLVVALMIRLESKGPIFFRQVRTGFNGRTFKLWKFRSMYADKTDQHAERQTSRDDPRVTRVGRIIRRLSIDELPQLINVLEGTMSLVGPRPHALATNAGGKRLEELVDCYAVRHSVKPGMTGWAQIHGLRGELDSVEKLRKRVQYDIDYIDRWTIWLDIEIIARTVLLVLRDSRAY
jgi:polysaccharide biosynthesis protein PslA